MPMKSMLQVTGSAGSGETYWAGRGYLAAATSAEPCSGAGTGAKAWVGAPAAAEVDWAAIGVNRHAASTSLYQEGVMVAWELSDPRFP